MLAQQVAYWNYVETNRHNLATEALTGRELDIKASALAEDVRHNKETESISWFNAQENARHNRETESVSWYNAKESQRHNRVTENIGWFSAQESQRHNIATESTARLSATGTLLRGQAALQTAGSNARKVQSEIELNKRRGSEIDAEIALKNEQARSQKSQRFVNWTSGARNIVQSVTGISSEVRSWLFWN